MFAWTHSMFYSIQHSIWDFRVLIYQWNIFRKKNQDEITCYKKKETHHVSVLYEHAYLFYEKISYHKYIFYPQYLNCMVFPLYNVFTSVSFNLQKTSTTLRIKSLRDNKRNFIIKHLMVVLKITKKEKTNVSKTRSRFKNICGRQFSRI